MTQVILSSLYIYVMRQGLIKMDERSESQCSLIVKVGDCAPEDVDGWV